MRKGWSNGSVRLPVKPTRRLDWPGIISQSPLYPLIHPACMPGEPGGQAAFKPDASIQTRRVRRTPGGERMAESRLNTKEQVRTLWQLGGLTVRQLAGRVWAELQHDDILGRASELAYNFVLALFPLLMVLVTILGMMAERGTRMRELLFYGMGNVMPGSVSELISKTINEAIQASSGGKLTLGIVLTLWAAAGGTAAMMSGLNAAYDIRDARSWFKVRGIALALTLAISVLVIGALTVVLAGNWIADLAGSRLGIGDEVLLAWKIMQWPAALFFLVVSFALVYYFRPDVKEQHWYLITPGLFMGVFVWLAASVGFRVYLHFFDTYSNTYGSLGAAIILLIWFWVAGLAFLAGGEINAEIEHAAAHRGHPEAKAEGEKAA